MDDKLDNKAQALVHEVFNENGKLVVTFDPKYPEVFFEYLDKLSIDIVRQAKFMSVKQVLNLLESVELAKIKIKNKILTRSSHNSR